MKRTAPKTSDKKSYTSPIPSPMRLMTPSEMCCLLSLRIREVEESLAQLETAEQVQSRFSKGLLTEAEIREKLEYLSLMERYLGTLESESEIASDKLVVILMSVERYFNTDENWIPALQVCRRMDSFDESLIGAALKSYLRGQESVWESHPTWSALDDQDWFFLATDLLNTGS
jgi:hypothetical protein